MGISSTRVMGTCSVLGQAAGTAAAMALRCGESPRGIQQHHISELQDLLLEDDQFIPGFFRTVPELTRTAKASCEVLRDAWDRKWQDCDHGAWIAPGGSAEYSWDSPQTVSSCRIVFDTDLRFKGKRQHKLEGVSEYIPMPPMLAKGFRIEAHCGDGTWKTLFSDADNYQRLRRAAWPPFRTDRVRLTVDSTFGAEKAHVFSFEVK